MKMSKIRIMDGCGRFAAFESWNAFSKNVLQGKVSYQSMRQEISAHDRLKAKGGK